MMSVLFVVLVALAAPSSSSDSASQSGEEDRLVCRDEIRTNTRFSKRICMTVSERETIRRNAQDAAKRIVEVPFMTPPER